MAQIATVILSGFIAMEPKLWFTKQQHTAVVHLRIGTTPRRVDPLTGAWQDGTSSFFTVNCWRRLALNVHASLHKGDPVIIRGRLKTRSWMEDGKNRTLVEIDADSIGHDLSFGWSHYLRGVHPSLMGLLDAAGNIDPEALMRVLSADGSFSVSGGMSFAGGPSAQDGALASEEPGNGQGGDEYGGTGEDRGADEYRDGDERENPFSRPPGEEPDAAQPLGELVPEEVPF